MKQISYSTMLLCSVVYLLVAKEASDTNALTKAFYHESPISDKVVCYFSKEPICNHMPEARSAEQAQNDAQASMKHVRFFMPLTQINGDAQQSIPKINESKHTHYSIAFTKVQKPMNGVQVQIAYDPQHIGFEYEQFDAIHTHKGIVFKFHHKQTLQELNKKTNHILQYACNTTKVPTIIIDNGHGGHDTGKVGLQGVLEKDVNLYVGNHLAKLLKKKGYNVVVTRKSDVFVPLDIRTSVANKLQADLFVSIHSNGAGAETAAGIETYWAPQTLLKSELGDVDEFTRQAIAQQHTKRDAASKRLAKNVHTNVLDQAKKFYNVKDRNIKESVSQVLLGTDMPAALIELGFLSNKEESCFLAQVEYQIAVAEGICSGIESYLQEV